jgi:hypothetical protein
MHNIEGTQILLWKRLQYIMLHKVEVSRVRRWCVSECHVEACVLPRHAFDIQLVRAFLHPNPGERQFHVGDE